MSVSVSAVPDVTSVVNALTIDVEDYYHVSAFDGVVSRDQWDQLPSRVVDNTSRLLDLLAEHEVRATFFVLGWVAERHPALVRRIAALGHEVASHSYWHRLVYELTPDGFREDLARARAVLEDAAGVRVLGFRAPSYSVTARSLWALDVLMDEGYTFDASIFPIHHDRYGIPDAPRHPHLIERDGGSLVEIPASTVRAGGMNWPIAGGGYFRLLPYAWTRWGIARVNARERRAVVFYLHPWEIDPDQPRLPAGRVTRLRHYCNLAATEGRLRQLLQQFRFAPIGEALAASLPSDVRTPARGCA